MTIAKPNLFHAHCRDSSILRRGNVLARIGVFAIAMALLVAPGMADDKVSAAEAKPSALSSEIPEKFVPSVEAFDHVRKNVMIPMRDGVKLHTVILIPKGAKGAPILLTRTPYDATRLTTHVASSNLGVALQGYDNAVDVIIDDGYIRVVQDVRGKHGSEGEYVLGRPLRGPGNPTAVDHATDTYDTIDWLVKNVPESNGKVGILGISYDGFLPLMALVDPHPALKVSVPMNPMVDGWIGDDWFHYGAFRQQMMDYIYRQVATRKSDAKWWMSHHDDYDFYLEAGTAGELGRRRGLEQIGFWKKLLEHPNYDAFWRDQALDKLLAARPLTVPVMLVHSLWDQEDIYGAPAVYKALEPKDTANDKVFLVIGPWNHGQMIHEGSSLGAIKFSSDTALYFRQEILKPFLARYLLDRKADVAPVHAFETGANKWRAMKTWPSGGDGLAVKTKPLYVKPGGKLDFDAPNDDAAPHSEYVSDPAKPIPYCSRPIQGASSGEGRMWPKWLVTDQRDVATRPDVLVFTSAPLTAPLRLAGAPVVNLVASTSGTDSDWVVKLIDVYPDQAPGQIAMGGYQLMIAADIFRGRFHESFEAPKPLEANKPTTFRFELPTVSHVLLPGHRLMVQAQSSWFPLYDRNPQTFVPSIFWAKPADFQKATQRVFHAPGRATMIELPVVESK